MPDISSHPPAVRVEGARVRLGAHRILAGIDLDVADGQTVALLGANGSGKTTLVKALLGLIPLETGRITLYGADVAHRRQVQWSRIGYVPQRIGAAAPLAVTAAEVVASGLLTERRLVPSRRHRHLVLDALDEVGLADRAQESVGALSGGQHQRVLLARALVRAPDLLVVDEPLSGIDLRSQEALAVTLRTLQLKGTTIVVVLHDLGLLAPLLERAVVLDHGSVVLDGAPSVPDASGGKDVPAFRVRDGDECASVDAHQRPASALMQGWRS